MANCIKCNAPLAEGAKFCTICGTKQEQDFADKFANITNTADTTNQYDSKDIEDNKFMAVLAYLGILFLVPLFAAKDSKFAQFHTNQGIILAILSLANCVLLLIPFLGWIAAPLIGLCLTALTILGIVNVCTGKAQELPIIGKYKILK